MTSALKCIAKPNLPPSDFPKLFGSVCGLSETACSGFDFDTATGAYGPYMGCNDIDKLSHAFNAYYLENKSADDACDFGGSATVVAKPTPASSCESVIASATSAAPTGSGGAGGDGGDGGGDESAGNSVYGLGGWGAAAAFTAVVVTVAGMVVL
ncbi:hypothetical protein V493_02962 [Pseudogymnoascus sp. VKM F-4281 (FW-2241)]|nr:hypothetical protein V493_02962 [Pseudogymnoascus sp. VKM F-4281 (FW-2241)]